jgi:hypothetical protein
MDLVSLSLLISPWLHKLKNGLWMTFPESKN